MRLVIDVEADGLNEVIINNKGTPEPSGTQIWCVCAYDLDADKMYTFDPHQLVEAKALLHKATLVIGHNILGFDLPILERVLGCVFKCKVWDTLVCSKLIHPDINNHAMGDNSLASWGKFLKNPKQDYTGGFAAYSEEMLKYCVQDVILCKEIFEHQALWVEKNKYEKILDFETRVSWCLMKQTVNGFTFDLKQADELSKELFLDKVGIEDSMRLIFPDITRDRISEKTGKLLKPITEVFNPGSRQQIAQRLKDKYGWEPDLSDKGNPIVDETALAALTYPEAKELIKYFNCQKLIASLEDWKARANHSRDGKVHGFVNAQGAATGRCTHSQPNVAQVSADHRARSLWLPEHGDVLVGCDLSGLELRMLANYMWKYDGGEYGNTILTGDIHAFNQKAAGLADRNTAKTFIFGFIYGGGDTKIGEIVGGSAKAGAKLKAEFLKKLPALDKVQQEAKFSACKNKYVELPDGRRVPVRKEYAALNTLLQGSGAILSKYWMVLSNSKLSAKYGNKVKQVAYIHDELQFSCPPDIAQDVGLIVTQCATEAGIRLGIKMRMDAQFKIGTNWSETH